MNFLSKKWVTVILGIMVAAGILNLTPLLTAPARADWTQIGADIDGEAAGDRFGAAVSLSSDGTILAVGQHVNDVDGIDAGFARVYENSNDIWTQIGSDLYGEAPGSVGGYFATVALSSDGTILAVGEAQNNDNGDDAGSVRVYENIAGVWAQIGNDIDGEAAGDLSGDSVTLSADGSIVAIGAPGNDDNGDDAGSARVYENIAGVWTQIGSDINGEDAGDRFGSAVTLSADGTILAIGAPANTGVGQVQVYKNVANVWTQVGSDINGEGSGSQFGGVVALSSDGTILAVGEINSDRVQVYENINNVWTQVGSDIVGEDNLFGHSVALSADGAILAIGIPDNDDNGEYAGQVRVYENIAGVWTQIGNDIDGEAAGDSSGFSVALSADGAILAIGALGNDVNGDYTGHVRVFEYIPDEAATGGGGGGGGGGCFLNSICPLVP